MTILQGHSTSTSTWYHSTSSTPLLSLSLLLLFPFLSRSLSSSSSLIFGAKFNVHGRYPAQIWGSYMLPRFRPQKPATQIPLIIHPRHIGDDQMRDLTRRSRSKQHPLKDQSQRPPTSTSITPTTPPSHGRTFDHRTEGPNPLIYNTILITILLSWVRRTFPSNVGPTSTIPPQPYTQWHT